MLHWKERFHFIHSWSSRGSTGSDIKLQTFPVEFFGITRQGLMRPPPFPLVNDHLSYIKTSRQKILISLYPRSPSFQTEANSFTIEKNFTFPVIDREKDLDSLVAWSIRFARSSVRVTRGRGGTTIESKTYASRSSNVFTRYVTFRFNAFYGSTANTRFSPCVHVVEVPREYWWAFKMN